MVSRDGIRTQYDSNSKLFLPQYDEIWKKDRCMWVGSNEDGRVAKNFLVHLKT